jgi:hypothetical protein
LEGSSAMVDVLLDVIIWGGGEFWQCHASTTHVNLEVSRGTLGQGTITVCLGCCQVRVLLSLSYRRNSGVLK